MKEIWKDVIGYEGYYQVSNIGRVKSLPNKCRFKKNITILKPHKEKSGTWYPKVVLYNFKGEARGRTKAVHQLVAQAFIRNPQKKLHVNHIDADKTNNYITNLEWTTHLENMRHARYNNLITPKRISVVGYIGEIIMTFDSMLDAQKATGIHNSGISSACKREGKSGGYYWRYV